jgi:hypothetical protein
MAPSRTPFCVTSTAASSRSPFGNGGNGGNAGPGETVGTAGTGDTGSLIFIAGVPGDNGLT